MTGVRRLSKIVRAIKAAEIEWKEELHPRGPDGQFVEGTGSLLNLGISWKGLRGI